MFLLQSPRTLRVQVDLTNANITQKFSSEFRARVAVKIQLNRQFFPDKMKCEILRNFLQISAQVIISALSTNLDELLEEIEHLIVGRCIRLDDFELDAVQGRIEAFCETY